jgi:putative ATP-binding cassette transporter
MNLVRFLLKSSRGTVVISAVAGVVAGVAGIAMIVLIQHELAGEPSASSTMAWAFAGLCLVSAAARVVGQIAMARLGQRTGAELGLQIVRHTLELPLREFESINSSALLAALTEDIALIASAMVGVPHLCINFPIVIACLVYIGCLSLVIIACGVSFAALAIAVYIVLSSRGVKQLRRARESQDALVGHFRTLIGGFRELKLHRGRRASFADESVEPTMASVRRDLVRGLGSFAVAEGWSQIAFFGFIGALLFAIPRLESIGRPTLISAVLVVLYLMAPLDTILTWLPIMGRARASLQKIQSLIPALEGHCGTDEGRPASAAQLALRASVSLEAATFAYDGAIGEAGFVLGPVDLTLRRGEIVILAGGNGSGKTTLVKLISGLYAPDEGTLRLDGRVIHDDDREAYRQLVTVVFADGHLFSDFRGVGPDGLEARAREGLKDLGLADQVAVLGSSFSTTDLSHGQRRRLALLGALLEDRPILILDEWAANQDPTFKPFFYHSLLPELRAEGKAILVISHDEPHFDVADRTFRLQDGRLLQESHVRCGGAWA